MCSKSRKLNVWSSLKAALSVNKLIIALWCSKVIEVDAGSALYYSRKLLTASDFDHTLKKQCLKKTIVWTSFLLLNQTSSAQLLFYDITGQTLGLPDFKQLPPPMDNCQPRSTITLGATPHGVRGHTPFEFGLQ